MPGHKCVIMLGFLQNGSHISFVIWALNFMQLVLYLANYIANAVRVPVIKYN